jgi:predicted HAD superfamily Cof-like phosphohydrolase
VDILEIQQWFRLAVPNPTDRNRGVQIGCHLEESAEFAIAIGDPELAQKLHAMATYYKEAGRKANHHVDRLELLDACCDGIVTLVGVAHMFGFDLGRALAEVNRSNWSKFVDGVPVFDANGKIAKPPTYTPPKLDRYV